MENKFPQYNVHLEDLPDGKVEAQLYCFSLPTTFAAYVYDKFEMNFLREEETVINKIYNRYTYKRFLPLVELSYERYHFLCEEAQKEFKRRHPLIAERIFI